MTRQELWIFGPVIAQYFGHHDRSGSSSVLSTVFQANDDLLPPTAGTFRFVSRTDEVGSRQRVRRRLHPRQLESGVPDRSVELGLRNDLDRLPDWTAVGLVIRFD